MNLEMADTDEMLRIALEIIPRHCCLVPERRAELTTEGGLDVPAHLSRLTETCHMLESAGIAVSLFIDPEPEQVTAAAQCGASTIEIHTGRYADAPPHEAARELQRVAAAAALGRDAGLIVNAGHGLHCHNVGPIAALTAINELNIGHAIIARAVFVGLRDAVREIKAVMLTARAASAG
jgi:pyridoxine 5-phosphate synthase